MITSRLTGYHNTTTNNNNNKAPLIIARMNKHTGSIYAVYFNTQTNVHTYSYRPLGTVLA